MNTDGRFLWCQSSSKATLKLYQQFTQVTVGAGTCQLQHPGIQWVLNKWQLNEETIGQVDLESCWAII